MCLAEVIVRPLTMRLLDPWHFRRPHRLWRLRLQLQPRLACKVVAGMQRLFLGGCRLCLAAVLGGGKSIQTFMENPILDTKTMVLKHEEGKIRKTMFVKGVLLSGVLLSGVFF